MFIRIYSRTILKQLVETSSEPSHDPKYVFSV